MKRISIFALILMFVIGPCLAVLSAERPERVTGIGAGFFAGMSGISGELLFHVPKARFNTNDLYFRLGIALTDSVNLTPGQSWRRFTPLYMDGIYYFTDDAYFGAGLNVPLKVSDDETGTAGGQLFLGSDLKIDPLGKIYGEVGYSTLNMLGSKSFAGLYLTFGWRSDFDLIGAMTGK